MHVKSPLGPEPGKNACQRANSLLSSEYGGAMLTSFATPVSVGDHPGDHAHA
jgi:hypothetical protein